MKRRPCSDAAAFRYGHDLVGFDVFYDFDGAGGPPNFELVCPRRLCHAEMYAQIALGKITRAGLDFTQQNLAADSQF